MADVNINAPDGQAPTMAPPVRTDDQILPRIRWVPIGKSKCYLDLDKAQSNPIYKIMLDTQWFVLTKETLREALQIITVNNNQAFVTPPSSDALINFVNELGYPNDPDSPAPRPTKPARKPKSTVPKAPLRPSVLTLVTLAQPIPTSAQAKPQEKKRKQTIETSDKPTKAKKSKYGFVRKNALRSLWLSQWLKMHLLRNLREPESGKYQLLPEVPRKGKAKVTEEQVAHDLLSLQNAKKKSPADQYIFQSRTSTPTGSSRHDESSYAELGKSDSEDESKKTRPDTGTQEEGQAVSNLEEQYEGQARPDPRNAGADELYMPSLVVHAGSDREHMDLDVADVSPQPLTEPMDEGFTATAYPKVQENLKLTVEKQVLLEEPTSSSGTLSSLQHLSKDISFGDLFFNDKPLEADIDKANAKTKVKSMVSITIQQDMSSIPPMTSPIIDLTSRPESPKVHQEFKATVTKTTTTTTTTLPPPPDQQQRTVEAMMMKRIGELENIMANLI
nr:hypothetical protein [Tanacetum cinerariifolium]